MADDINKDIGKHSGPTLSFPSTFNTGGNDFILYGANTKHTEIHSKVRTEDGQKLDTSYKGALLRIKSKNLDVHHFRNMYMDENVINISNYNKYLKTISLGKIENKDSTTYYEDPFHLPSDMLREINWYRFIYKNPTLEIMSTNTETGETTYFYGGSSSSPSLFNPKFNVQSIGMTHNVPLMLGETNRKHNIDPDVSDCSATKLIELSQTNQMGQQKYRLVDFIFGADYGKVSNNHMITLRRFALPVGDIIGEGASPQYESTNPSQIGVNNSDDIAHLVTWFGTEDNKLEDIVKYSYEYTWKQLEAKRQDIDSKEGDDERGLIGLFANMTPQHARAVNDALHPPAKTLLGRFTSFLPGGNVTSEDAKNKLRMYDNNVVYTPLQTIQDTHIPEGKLKFSNEFTLTFRYKMRAYENINPKSAFLDLLANIHECTYFRGKFWGGSQNIIGPGPNNSQYSKAYKMIDNAFDKLGGALKSLASGGFNLESVFGMLSSLSGSFGEAFQGLLSGDGSFKDKLKGVGEAAKNKLGELINQFGPQMTDIMKGQLKNALGRPAFYAFDSLLSDKIVGLWHVTIGNPRNPIVSMGNLILTKAEVQHSGPLGLDDFPTELRVICTLKHAMSRDLTGIQKMYTQGISAIYQTKQRNKMADQLLGPDTGGIAKSLDDLSSKTDAKERFAQRESLDTAMIKQIQEQDYSLNDDRLGRIRDSNTARIAQLGTSNIFKLQIALDQIAPTIG